VSGGADLPGLCLSCLLRLALAADGEGEPDDDPVVPGAAYRVITVLASERDRTTYLAEHGDARRLVTLDLVGLPPAEPEAGLARCRGQLRALREWVHPGIPRILDGRRTASGDFCVVAQYVAGPRIDRFCHTERLDPEARTRLFARLCDIVSDGHRHGVCHGRLGPDAVIVSGTAGARRPLVLGYSVAPDREPAIGDDVAGLDAVARAMGWEGRGIGAWPDVAALCAATASGWRGPTAGGAR
jgi:hypothetical protein